MHFNQKEKYLTYKIPFLKNLIQKYGDIYKRAFYPISRPSENVFLDFPQYYSNCPFLEFHLVLDNPDLEWNFYNVFSREETSFNDIKKFFEAYPDHDRFDDIVAGILENNPNISKEECKILNEMHIGYNFELSFVHPNFEVEKILPNIPVQNIAKYLHNPRIDYDTMVKYGIYFSNPKSLFQIMRYDPTIFPLMYISDTDYVLKNLYKYGYTDESFFSDGLKIHSSVSEFFRFYKGVVTDYTLIQSEFSADIQFRKNVFVKICEKTSYFSRNIDKLIRKRLNYV
jgi:hypothetical protein